MKMLLNPQNKDIFFFMSYTALIVALFLGDITKEAELEPFARMLRLVSYAIIMACFIGKKHKAQKLGRIILFVALTLVYGILTRDFYIPAVAILIYCSTDIECNQFIKANFCIIVIGTVLVLLLCAVKLLPDALTSRDTIINIEFNRHTFGFSHSNVLPLIILYLECYYIAVNLEKIKVLWILGFCVISTIVYELCKARNPYYLVMALSTVMLIFEYRKPTRKLTKVLGFFVKWIGPILCIISVICMFMIVRGGIWDRIDYFFSGRFRLGILKSRNVGLHIVNIISNEDFFKDGIVVDNGYLYLLLRYGVFFWGFSIYILMHLTKKNEHNAYFLTVLGIVYIANFIDNDFVDYSFLPFLLITFNKTIERECRIIHVRKGVYYDAASVN